VIAAVANDTTNPLVAYGLLGVILVAFVYLTITNKVVSGKTYQEALDRAAKAETRTQALEDSLRHDVLPVMTRFVDLQADLTLRHRGGHD
jgi:hypothetical protein